MTLLAEQSSEAGNEKHLPVVEKRGNGIVVKVGSIPHPMLPEHFIQWIEVLTADGVCRKELSPGQAPEAEFEIKLEAVVAARELCNLHGLWKKA
jgi:superoxide reductase